MSRRTCPACGQPLTAALQAFARELRQAVARLDADARRFDDRGPAVFAGDVRGLRRRLAEVLSLVEAASGRDTT